MKKNKGLKVTSLTKKVGRHPESANKTPFTGGKMGIEVSAKDWSKTPLGPIDKWPQSLRTTVSLCLASNFPISIAWGPKRVQIYNDGYWQICGDKHPASMGQDFKECWFTAWPVIGDAFESATDGQTKFLVNQRMFLDRNGYLEETFFTFSFSPIKGESGGVDGLFHPVIELTQQSLGDRRMIILRNIAARTMNAKTSAEAIALIMEVIKESELDIPFGLLYTLNAEGDSLTLKKSTGLPSDSGLCANEINLEEDNGTAWPFKKAIHQGIPVKIEKLKNLFGEFKAGPYDEAPHTAFLFPILLPGLKHPFGIFVAGLSSRRVIDDPYATFFELVSAAITGAITKAKAFEDELKKAEALLEIDRAKTTFFSNISHEFRTPLTLMLGPLEDTLHETKDSLTTEQRERLQLVQRNALRLQRLVNNLLDFSRIEAGRLDAKFLPTNLSTFTRELASAFSSAMQKADIDYVVDCKPLSQAVYIDRDMWEKIVLNLLSNALKFTFQGRIKISVHEEKGSAILKVSDSGEGIPENELPNLFKRFYRVQGTKSRTHEGSGIGLALIHELIKIHAGSIEAESKLKKGTTFSVRIPFGKLHLPKEKIANEITPIKNTSQSDVFTDESSQWISKETSKPDEPIIERNKQNNEVLILVVDDNADMREYVTRILSKNEKWKIQTAGNGVQALAFIKNNEPDLILSDIMMPEMDGFQLLKNIREDFKTRQLPVILLSARAGEEATVDGLEKKANDYLVKPFSARELFTRIKTQLDLDSIRKRNIELIADMVNKNSQLEYANKELDAFSYSVSHDLRAPLRSIDGYTRILLEDYGQLLNEDGQKVLQSVLNNAQRMGQLIDDLLAFAHLGRQELKKVAIDMNSLAKEIADELIKQQDKNRSVDLRLQHLAPAHGDVSMIKQVLVNLISNALKYSGKTENPVITIQSSRKDEATVYSVMDNGVGFDMNYYHKLFGVFQRLHRPTDFEGTGVGLAIAHRIVRKHEGRIWAEGKVNEGAAFHFLLPGDEGGNLLSD
jgi:signal transduction histidine kinase